jgi:ABC-type glycerol-3-phosphate transport system permease component
MDECDQVRKKIMNKFINRRFQQRFGDIAVYCILTLLVLIFVFPFIWMILTSLKTLPQVNTVPIVWLPNPPQWHNFVDAFTEYIPFGPPIKNTLFVAVLVIIGTLLSSSLAAYSFGCIKFPGREMLFGILLATMMIPFMVRLIPLFLIYRNLGWLNTLYPLWVPAFFGTAFYIFLMRQFFQTVPSELAEAAYIDGCSEFGIWWRIMLPLSRPVLIVVGIFAFQGVWNQFLEPFIFISDRAKYTVMMAVWFIVSAPYQRPWHHLMAVSAVVILPMVVVFFVAQRKMVQGITTTGLKG